MVTVSSVICFMVVVPSVVRPLGFVIRFTVSPGLRFAPVCTAAPIATPVRLVAAPFPNASFALTVSIVSPAAPSGRKKFMF